MHVKMYEIHEFKNLLKKLFDLIKKNTKQMPIN